MGKHGTYPRVDGDHCPTPDWVVAALAEHVDLAGKVIWEPTAGDGCMAEALKAAGASVFCSDNVDRGYPLGAALNFTSALKAPIYFDGIVTNPAYGHGGRIAERFIAAGLRHTAGGGFLALLLAADFDSAKTRPRFCRDCPLFAAKIVLTRRITWFSYPDPDRERPKENHSWCVWRHSTLWSTPLILYAPRNYSTSQLFLASKLPATAGCPSSTPATLAPEKDQS